MEHLADNRLGIEVVGRRQVAGHTAAAVEGMAAAADMAAGCIAAGRHTAAGPDTDHLACCTCLRCLAMIVRWPMLRG